MVTAVDHVGPRSMFWPKNSLLRSKNKQDWFSGACEPIQMKFIQMVEPLSQFLKIAVKIFWVFIQEDNARPTMLPVSHFDKQERQAQPYS